MFQLSVHLKLEPLYKNNFFLLHLDNPSDLKESITHEKALNYILYLVDTNQLFNIALGLYDFEVVLMVAEKSQKVRIFLINSIKICVIYHNVICCNVDNTACGGVIFEHRSRICSMNLCLKIPPPQRWLPMILNLVRLNDILFKCLKIIIFTYYNIFKDTTYAS